MSKTGQSQIVRQWHIIQFLVRKDKYVSVDDILKYLEKMNINVTDRTIQRDMQTLSDVLPVECRCDDKPYSYRWERVPDAKKSQLDYKQAMLFSLIDSELRDHLPPDLLARLSPLFIKSQFMLAGIDQQIDDLRKNNQDFKDLIDTYGTEGLRGIIGRPRQNFIQIFLKRRLADLSNLTKLSPFYKPDEPWQKQVKKEDLVQLQSELKEQGFDEFAGVLSGLIKKLK